MTATRFSRRDAQGNLIHDRNGIVQSGQVVGVPMMFSDAAPHNAQGKPPMIFDPSNPLTWGFNDAGKSGVMAAGNAVGSTGRPLDLPVVSPGTQLASNEYEQRWIQAQAKRDVAYAQRKRDLASAWQEGTVPPMTSTAGQVSRQTEALQGNPDRAAGVAPNWRSAWREG